MHFATRVGTWRVARLYSVQCTVYSAADLSLKPFGIGRVYIYTFLLRMADTVNIDLSYWDTMYIFIYIFHILRSNVPLVIAVKTNSKISHGRHVVFCTNIISTKVAHFPEIYYSVPLQVPSASQVTPTSYSQGRPIAQAVSRWLPTAAARVRAQVRSCGICGGQKALGQVFCGYFGFPCQFSFHRLLHTRHLSSGAGTRGQLVADVPSGLSLTPPQETKKKKSRSQSSAMLLLYIES
jgi:hypothetical protein